MARVDRTRSAVARKARPSRTFPGSSSGIGERYYRVVVETAQEGIWIMNREFRTIYVNDALLKMLGYRRAEIIGEPIGRFVSPDELTDHEQRMRQRMRGRSEIYQRRFLRKDGSVCITIVSATALRDEYGQFDGSFAMLTDVTAQAAALQALREKDAEISRMLDALTGGVWKWWPATGVLEFSPKYYTMLGYDPSDFPPSYDSWISLIHPEDRNAALSRAVEFMRSGTDTYRNQFRMRTKSGDYRTISAFGKVVERGPNGEPHFVIGHHQDISDQVQEQEYTAMLARMLDEAPGSITVHDHNGRFLYANQKTFELHGYSKEEFMALNLRDVDAPASAALIEQRIAEVVKNGHAEFKVIHRHKDGRQIPMHVSVKPIRWGGTDALFSVATDLTKLEASERERARLAAAVEQAQDIVVITDPDANIRYVNRKFTEVTGYAASEVVGSSPRILQSGSHDAAFYRSLWETILGGHTWRGVFINRKKNGDLYTEEATISPVYDSSGEIESFIAVKRDITEHLNLRAESDALAKKLQHYQKMETVGRLAGGVAHDFNNTLQIIRGCCDMLAAQVDGREVQELIGQIQRAVEMSAGLTHQLLAVARRQPVAPKIVDPTCTVRDSCSLLRKVVPENIGLTFEQSGEPRQIRIDPVQLEQVLMNLVVNARDALADRNDGVIEVTVCNKVLRTPLAAVFDTIPAGEYVVLSVRDNGPGIPDALLQEIFEPFVTTKPHQQGTGLGLATVYGIARQNGGFVDVDGGMARRAGATFSVYFPVYAAPQAPHAQRLALDMPTHKGTQLNILLMEDEPMLRKLATMTLKNLGHTVIAPETTAEALDTLRNPDMKVSLLMTDVVMPGMSGPELVSAVRTTRPDLPVLYVSGYADDVTGKPTTDQRLSWFIRKPYSIDELRAMLERIHAHLEA